MPLPDEILSFIQGLKVQAISDEIGHIYISFSIRPKDSTFSIDIPLAGRPSAHVLMHWQGVMAKIQDDISPICKGLEKVIPQSLFFPDRFDKMLFDFDIYASKSAFCVNMGVCREGLLGIKAHKKRGHYLEYGESELDTLKRDLDLLARLDRAPKNRYAITMREDDYETIQHIIASSVEDANMRATIGIKHLELLLDKTRIIR